MTTKSIALSWMTVKQMGIFVCLFLRVQVQHMKISRLEAESELQLPACTIATATQDLSCICDLHHSSWQCWILHPLSEARDRTCNLMVTSRINFCCATMGTPVYTFWEWFERKDEAELQLEGSYPKKKSLVLHKNIGIWIYIYKFKLKQKVYCFMYV